MEALWIRKFQDTHVAAWNERDRAQRDELLNTIYAPDIKMYDPNAVFQNLTEVSDFIGKLHSGDPEFYFSAARPVEATQNGLRLYGHIGTIQKPDRMNSMDFFIIENNKAKHLYVFMEKGNA